MEKDIFKTDILSHIKIVKEEILPIRIDGSFLLQNCHLKLYTQTNTNEGKLEITKVKNGKEQKKPLQTVTSKNVIHIREWNETPQSIYIESADASLIMINPSKDSQTEWLKNLFRYLLPKEKDEAGLQSVSRAKTFRVDSLHSLDFQTTEKDLLLEIQDKKTLLLKSRDKVLETWELNEIKTFKFNEGLFKISVGRQHAYDEAKKYFEFRMPNGERHNLKSYLSDILHLKRKQSKEQIKPNKPISRSTKNINKTIPPRTNIGTSLPPRTSLGSPPLVPSPPQPIKLLVSPRRSVLLEENQVPKQNKIIPSSDDYEEPYEELNVNKKTFLNDRRLKFSQDIPSSEEYESPPPDFILPKNSPPDKFQRQSSHQENIIPSNDLYEEPNEEFQPTEIADHLPKQPEHLGICGVISKTISHQKSIRLDRYPGPKDGNLYTNVRKNIIKHLLHSIVRHKT